MLNLGLAIIPVSRDSIFQRIFKIPFEQGLVYHRITARILVTLVTTHGFLWFIFGLYNLLSSDGYEDWHEKKVIISAITGFLSWICMISASLFALEKIRRKYFELFYITHHLFIGTIIFALFHSLAIYYHEENPWKQSRLIYYLIPGGSLYIIDRILRVYKTVSTESRIVVLDNVRPGITSIQIGSNLKYYPGQYCFINCPNISRFQWHPYSIASGTTDDLIFHVKSMGKGTWSDRLNKLARKLEDDGSCTEGNSSFGSLDSKFAVKFHNVLSLRIDGPYGNNYLGNKKTTQHFYFLAGGIGITPIVSIIKSLIRDHTKFSEMISIHLLWVVKSADELLWFGSFLQEFNYHSEYGKIKLKYKLFVTGNDKNSGSIEYIPPQTYEAYDSAIYTSATDIEPGEHTLLIDSSGTPSLAQEMRKSTDFNFSPGRPNFFIEFNEIIGDICSYTNKIDTKCEVLSCGPPEFDKSASFACDQVSSKKLRFKFTSQTFML